jgi:DNA recombination protein RmuC
MEMIVTVIAVLAGLVVGGLAVWFLRGRELAAVQAEQTHRDDLITEMRNEVLAEFRVGAAETIARQNRDQIEAVLAPLRDKLVEFQTGLQNAHTESVRERASLGEQIRSLAESGSRMTHETENLTRALKGDSKVQGAWGEMLLTTILERSGLRLGEEYEVQQTHPGADGGKIRPDVIVRLPHKHVIVVDAKVSLTAFERFVNATADADRAGFLDQHVASMRSHIEKLSAKEYWRVDGCAVDYVILFCPIEAALGAALQRDPDLTAMAVERSVAIATPTTLMIALRTVANLWRVERQNKNALEIAQKAGRLYDKFVGFIVDMDNIGSRLEAAKTSHAAAMGKLSTGQGNLVGQAETLRRMGASTTKALPSELLGELPLHPPV